MVRCGKYGSRACTLVLAPVQVRDAFGVLLKRATLKVPFATHQGRLPASGRPSQRLVGENENEHHPDRGVANERPSEVHHVLSEI
jgi:hypothetical protein